MRKEIDYLKKWTKEHPDEPMIRCARQPVEGDVGPTVELGELNIAASSLIHVDSSGDAQRIADVASAQLFISQGTTTVPAWKAVSGDVTIDSAGLVAIASGVIVNADVKSDAAIAYSKLEALTSANLLVGSSGNVATVTAITGDVTISNTGVTAIGASKVTNAMLAGLIALSQLIDQPEANATADQSDTEIETAYNNQVGAMSQATAEAGTSITIERITAQRVKQAIAALATDVGVDLTTKGDIHGYDTVQKRIPVGINDQVLTADSAQALGLKWAAAGGGISNIVEDTTPQLGGTLDANANNIELDAANFISFDGATGAQKITGSATVITFDALSGGYIWKLGVTDHLTLSDNGLELLALAFSVDAGRGINLSGRAGNSSLQEQSADDVELKVGGQIGLKLEEFATEVNLVCGAINALATNTTDGFLYIPTSAGAPTGVPTAYTGKVALEFDTTNNDLYIYDGAWIKVALA